MKASANVAKTLSRAVEVRDVVRRLRDDYGLTQSAIARATGTSARSVRNWEAISSIRTRNDERLRDLREIALILSDTLTTRGVGQWLRARNRLLKGRRPIDELAEGKMKAVRNAARAYVEGAYL
jgi:transcriptional regulator with XRE-family HTH domain